MVLKKKTPHSGVFVLSSQLPLWAYYVLLDITKNNTDLRSKFTYIGLKNVSLCGTK